MEYSGKISDISLIPYEDSYYKNFFVGLKDSKQVSVDIVKGQGVPIFTVENSKIVLLNRTLLELKKFKKELAINDEVAPQNQSEKEALDIADTPMFKLILKNSSIVLPRNSTSKEALVLLCELANVNLSKYLPHNFPKSLYIIYISLSISNLLEISYNILLGKTVKTVKMPTKLDENFEYIGTKQITRKDNKFHQIEGLFYLAELNLETVNAFYSSGGRKTKLGNAKGMLINLFAPCHRIYQDDWIFDADVNIRFLNYKFLMNLVR